MMSSEPSIGFLVNRTARLMRRLADQRLAPFGLSSGYLPVFTALMAGEALSQKELTVLAGIEQPSMAATLNRMERDGVVKRGDDPDDKRISRFSLSSRTYNKVGTIRKVIEALNREAVAGFVERDEEKLRQLLQDIAVTVEKTLGE